MSLKPMHNNPPSPGQLIAELIKNDDAQQRLLKSLIERMEKIEGKRISEKDIRDLATKFAFSETMRLVGQKRAQEAISRAYKAGISSVKAQVREARSTSVVAGIAFIAGLAVEALLLHL